MWQNGVRVRWCRVCRHSYESSEVERGNFCILTKKDVNMYYEIITISNFENFVFSHNPPYIDSIKINS